MSSIMEHRVEKINTLQKLGIVTRNNLEFIFDIYGKFQKISDDSLSKDKDALRSMSETIRDCKVVLRSLEITYQKISNDCNYNFDSDLSRLKEQNKKCQTNALEQESYWSYVVEKISS